MTNIKDVHPIRQEAITGGDDKTLRIWDLVTKKLITMIHLPDIVRSNINIFFLFLFLFLFCFSFSTVFTLILNT